MLCPADNRTLIPHRVADIEIDVCSMCNGVWFDEGEFRTAVNNIAGFKILEKYQLFQKTANGPAENRAENPIYERRILCSKDGSEMDTFHYDGNSGIYLDRCEKCQSIWLDNKEIELVRKHLAPNPTLDALHRAFVEHMREERKMRDELASLPLLPYFLFAPAFLLPMKNSFHLDHLPFVTITLLLVTASMPWVIGTTNDEFILATIASAAFLWVFGSELEKYFSYEWFILLTALTGFVGSISSWFENQPYSPSDLVFISSIVSGHLGAYLAVFPKEKIKLFLRGASFSMPSWFYIGGWFVLQFFALPFDTSLGNAFLSHMSGFVVGIIFGIIWKYFIHHAVAPSSL